METVTIQENTPQNPIRDSNPAATSNWTVIYSLSVTDENSFEDIPAASTSLSASLPINRNFAGRLIRLRLHAKQMQYELAYMNTIGGACHLCDHPRQAYAIAVRQEQLGHFIGSKPLVIRAKGYQAVNVGLLGHPIKAFQMLQEVKVQAEAIENEELQFFSDGMASWLRNQLRKQKQKTPVHDPPQICR